MRGQVGQKKRLIAVTDANIRNGHLYLTGNLGFFPAACFGSSSKQGPLGQLLTLEVEGLSEPVQTDIPTIADGTQPRRFFRNRAWVARFFKACRIKDGDFVALEKVDRFRIRVSRASAADVEAHVSLLDRRSQLREARESIRRGSGHCVNGQKKYLWPTKAPKGEYHPAALNDPLGIDVIKAVDWNNFRMIDLFAGIGGIRLGFEGVGGKGVFSSEWDTLAAKTYEANFRERAVLDITRLGLFSRQYPMQ